MAKRATEVEKRVRRVGAEKYKALFWVEVVSQEGLQGSRGLTRPNIYNNKTAVNQRVFVIPSDQLTSLRGAKSRGLEYTSAQSRDAGDRVNSPQREAQDIERNAQHDDLLRHRYLLPQIRHPPTIRATRERHRPRPERELQRASAATPQRPNATPSAPSAPPNTTHDDDDGARTCDVIAHLRRVDQLYGFSASPRSQSTTNGSPRVPVPGYRGALDSTRAEAEAGRTASGAASHSTWRAALRACSDAGGSGTSPGPWGVLVSVGVVMTYLETASLLGIVS